VSEEVKKHITLEQCTECGKFVIEHINQNQHLLKELTDTQKEYMNSIVQHTETVAATLKEYNENNTKLVNVISGKKQVPLSVFLLVLSSIVITTLIMFAALTHYQIILDESSLSVTKQIVEQQVVEKQRIE
jgi:hypothetical protein